MSKSYNPSWSMPKLASDARHYVVKGEYDLMRDNFHVSFGKPKMTRYDRDRDGAFAVVGWFESGADEDYFVVPYAAIRHLFLANPNKRTGWHVYVVRNRMYVVEEALGVVNVRECRSDMPDVRRLVQASLDQEEATVQTILSALAARCYRE